jgi:hypothetical protein
MITKKNIYILIFLLHAFCSCKRANEVLDNSNDAKLDFSEQAIVFDTIFTDVKSISKRLKVYNRNKNALRISQINVGGLQESLYKIFVNGEENKVFQNIDLMGGDSLLVLLSIQIASDNTDFKLAYDSLVFNTNGNQQTVKLLTWGENARVIKGQIPCNTVWDSTKAYLLMDSSVVAQSCNLTIKQGTKIYAFNDASLHIKGNLTTEGTPTKNIVFKYFRKEEIYQNGLGQWKGLSFYPTSTNNDLQYTTFQNAQVGLFFDKSKANISACTIRDMAVAGILAKQAEIYLNNSLIFNCITRIFQAESGGIYQLFHNTFANYEYDFNRNDEVGTGFIRETTQPEFQIKLYNNIFWGNLNDEILFNNVSTFEAGNNIFKSKLYATALNFNNNLINVKVDSIFKSSRKRDFRLPITSPALSKGISTSLLTDILGKPRKNPPDIGAFEK